MAAGRLINFFADFLLMFFPAPFYIYCILYYYNIEKVNEQENLSKQFT